jgi:hypothetical protein
MNTGTRNFEKARAIAQRLANDYNLPAVIFYPATSAGRGPLHVETRPSWWKGKEDEWSIMMESQGTTVVKPDPERLTIKTGDIVVYTYLHEDEYRLLTDDKGTGVLLGSGNETSIPIGEAAGNVKWTGRVIRGFWKGDKFCPRKIEREPETK